MQESIDKHKTVQGVMQTNKVGQPEDRTIMVPYATTVAADSCIDRWWHHQGRASYTRKGRFQSRTLTAASKGALALSRGKLGGSRILDIHHKAVIVGLMLSLSSKKSGRRRCTSREKVAVASRGPSKLRLAHAPSNNKNKRRQEGIIIVS